MIMKELLVVRELTGDGSEVVYVPVPCRCNLKSVRVVSDTTLVAAGTITVSGAGHTINLVTIPTGNIAAGAIIDGVPDTTYGSHVLDPASSTANERVISITDDATLLGGAGTVTLLLVFDDSAYVKETPKEA
jgi:hypothetical protein